MAQTLRQMQLSDTLASIRSTFNFNIGQIESMLDQLMGDTPLGFNSTFTQLTIGNINTGGVSDTAISKSKIFTPQVDTNIVNASVKTIINGTTDTIQTPSLTVTTSTNTKELIVTGKFKRSSGYYTQTQPKSESEINLSTLLTSLKIEADEIVNIKIVIDDDTAFNGTTINDYVYSINQSFLKYQTNVFVLGMNVNNQYITLRKVDTDLYELLSTTPGIKYFPLT